MRERTLAVALFAVSSLLFTCNAGAQQETLGLKIDDVMTARELKDTGVSGLTHSQLEALNSWLNNYTQKVLKLALSQNSKSSEKNDCVPAVESTMAGDFNGWDGETIFKLDNGEIWEQAEYDYYYSYSYRPDVTIYQASGGCRMKVEDEDETILVRRVR